jgi:hypothetical protein
MAKLTISQFNQRRGIIPEKSVNKYLTNGKRWELFLKDKYFYPAKLLHESADRYGMSYEVYYNDNQDRYEYFRSKKRDFFIKHPELKPLVIYNKSKIHVKIKSFMFQNIISTVLAIVANNVKDKQIIQSINQDIQTFQKGLEEYRQFENNLHGLNSTIKENEHIGQSSEQEAKN